MRSLYETILNDIAQHLIAAKLISFFLIYQFNTIDRLPKCTCWWLMWWYASPAVTLQRHLCELEDCDFICPLKNISKKLINEQQLKYKTNVTFKMKRRKQIQSKTHKRSVSNKKKKKNVGMREAVLPFSLTMQLFFLILWGKWTNLFLCKKTEHYLSRIARSALSSSALH